MRERPSWADDEDGMAGRHQGGRLACSAAGALRQRQLPPGRAARRGRRRGGNGGAVWAGDGSGSGDGQLADVSSAAARAAFAVSRSRSSCFSDSRGGASRIGGLPRFVAPGTRLDSGGTLLSSPTAGARSGPRHVSLRGGSADAQFPRDQGDRPALVQQLEYLHVARAKHGPGLRPAQPGGGQPPPGPAPCRTQPPRRHAGQSPVSLRWRAAGHEN